MSEPAPQVIKLTELSDIVAAIPFMVGFQPLESLVAVSIKGPRERLSFSLRLDLLPPENDGEVARVVAERMAHAKADKVMVFVFTAATPVDGVLPRESLVDELMRRCPMPMRDAVLVTPNRVWSYLCSNPVCCPPEGQVRDDSAPGSVAVAAAHALHGNVVLANRDAVVATVAPIGGIAAESMSQAIDRAGEVLVTTGPEAFRASTETLAADLHRRYADPPATMTDDEAGQLVIGLHDVRLRDQLVSWCFDDEGAMRTLLGDLTRRAQPPLDAPVCTVLACCSYLDGDGVVAMTALERALDSDPDYSFAGLLMTALQGQVNPTDLRAAMKSFEELKQQPVGRPRGRSPRR